MENDCFENYPWVIQGIFGIMPTKPLKVSTRNELNPGLWIARYGGVILHQRTQGVSKDRTALKGSFVGLRSAHWGVAFEN